MVRLKNSRLLVVLGLIWAMALLPAMGRADPVAVRAGERGEGARLVFEWPSAVSHSARLQGNRVIVTFDRSVEAQVGALAARLPEWVSSVALEDGARSVVITLRRPASLKSFSSGSRVVVDLSAVAVSSPVSPSPASSPPPAVEQKKSVQVAEKPAARPPAAASPVQLPRVAPTRSEATPPPSLPAPAAVGQSPAPTPMAAPAPVHKPEVASETKAGIAPPHPSSPQVAPAVDPAPAVEAPAEPVPASALPALSRQSGLPPLEMTVAAQTPVAAFVRGRSLFVVVGDKGTPSELLPLVGSALAGTDRVQLMNAQGGRVIRVDLRGEGVRPLVEATPTGWRLRFDAGGAAPLVPLELAKEPDYALGPRILVKVETAANPVTFVDPVVGDTLTAVPVAQTGAGVPGAVRFVQAELLPTLQGVAVRPWTDDLNVISSPMGVELSASSGFKLSERLAGELPSATAQATGQLEAPPVPMLPPLLDFSAMEKPAENFIARREELQQAVIAASEAGKPQARLDMARFYFVNGMPTEAAALWDMVARESADLAGRPEYPLIRAIAAFSSGTLDEAKAALTAVGQPTTDLALWRGLLAMRERDWVTASEQFRASLNRIWDYPEPYRSRLAIAAIETALNTQDYTLAEHLLERLSAAQRLVSRQSTPAVEYLSGVLDWSREREDEARARLGAAASSFNQYWRVRAELALIDADAKKPETDPYDLLRRVERLRYAWRGDALEFDILHRLSELHLKLGDYAGAFTDFEQMTEKFPSDPRTPALADEQRAAFIRIFQSEDRDKTPAYIQLAIWEGFPQFRPKQPAVLDEVRGYLAERVAGIDLLDKAAGFYREVLAGTTAPEARAALGARLAGLYLLDDKSQEALGILADTEPPAAGASRPQILPDSLRDERRILKARAVFRQGKPDEALSMLSNDYSEPAMRLRADVTWSARRWAEAAAVIDALVGPVPADGKLDEARAAMVVSRATALALAGDKAGLTRLRTDFGAAMAQTPQAATFQLVTRPDVAGGLPDRNTLTGRMAEVDLFQNFLERYRQPVPSTPPAGEAPSADLAGGPAARVVGPGATPQPVSQP